MYLACSEHAICSYILRVNACAMPHMCASTAPTFPWYPLDNVLPLDAWCAHLIPSRTGMKRKHTARAERAQEEAVEAGHLSRQAIAKTRRLQKAASAPNRDTGLGEHGGAFRGGVLRIAGGPPGGKLRAKAKRQLRG